MASRYKCSNGDKLLVDEYRGAYRLIWYVASEQDHGMFVGEGKVTCQNKEDEEDVRSAWEVNTAYDAAEPFAEYIDGHGFVFETKRKAQMALRVANEALLRGAPLPTWAVKAVEAGWKPPKNWKP